MIILVVLGVRLLEASLFFLLGPQVLPRAPPCARVGTPSAAGGAEPDGVDGASAGGMAPEALALRSVGGRWVGGRFEGGR